MLKKLNRHLKSKIGKTTKNYAIPDLWTTGLSDSDTLQYTNTNEALVDPYRFYSALIEKHFLNGEHKTATPLSKRKKHHDVGGDWLKESIIYSSMVRTSAAWDHDRSGSLEDTDNFGLKETGTFLKMMALLPFLKSIGIDTVYMLPIMVYSTKHKKGELGSPYGVNDFFKLDDALKDDLLSDSFTVEDEFKAFVDAAHTLGIRIVIDIIPRTNGIDSELIREHPDWFYWIKASEKPKYKTPYVDAFSEAKAPLPKRMKTVYESKDVKRHISMFQHNPKAQDEALFESIKDAPDILDAIEEHFDLTTAPAFSDNINDPQPPWSDVTFFRMYLDHPKETRKYLEDQDIPPYILYDTIKCNLYEGDVPNEPLWKTLEDVVPYFQRHYGIDGARIDMGHALPRPLLDRIIKRAREEDPDFGFIAEELDMRYAKDAREKGYNIIVGNGFIMQPRVLNGYAQKFYRESLKLKAPIFAAPETHDTPRIASRYGGRTLSNTLAALNHFMPRGVPFINAGLEVYERQPMNLGLDASDADKKHLDYHDPFYGKLALFDPYQLHYTNKGNHTLPAFYKALNPIRKNWVHTIVEGKNVETFEEGTTFIGYVYKKQKKKLLIAANLNPDHPFESHMVKPKYLETANLRKARMLFSTHEAEKTVSIDNEYGRLYLYLKPGEVRIFELT
ncbi:MAG: alpha-amylase family glycosyl hydrolase [Bacillota bacterium]